MNWDKFRKERISALEDSVKKKRVDEKILGLLKKINRSPDLVTTSSCAGRIVFLANDIYKRKKTASFYKKWHRKVDAEEVELALSAYAEKLPLWFRVEPFILHVTAKDVEAAAGFLKKARAAGVKRGGIQTVTAEKVTIEIQGSVLMIIPVDAVMGEWEKITDTANRMFDINLSQIKKLEKIRW